MGSLNSWTGLMQKYFDLIIDLMLVSNLFL